MLKLRCTGSGARPWARAAVVHSTQGDAKLVDVPDSRVTVHSCVDAADHAVYEVEVVIPRKSGATNPTLEAAPLLALFDTVGPAGKCSKYYRVEFN